MQWYFHINCINSLHVSIMLLRTYVPNVELNIIYICFQIDHIVIGSILQYVVSS